MKNLTNIERLLINVDMVNGFINVGVMHDAEIAKIVPTHIKLLKEFSGEKDCVFFVKDGHNENSVEFDKFPKHCVKGTFEAEIVEELKPFLKGANIYEKNSTSAIFAKGFLSDVAQMKNLKEVVIVGCCTDICVLNLALPLANYFDEMNRKVNIIVPKDAVETYNSPSHNREEYNEMAFKLMAQAGVFVAESYLEQGKESKINNIEK